MAATTLDSVGDSTGGSKRESLNLAVEFRGKTHKGMVRENNEDQFLVAKLAKSMEVCQSSLADSGSRLFSDEVGYLMVVADGMGGAAAGEKASKLAVQAVEDFALNTLKWFLHLGGTEEHVLLSELREGIERADRAVIDKARMEPKLQGMGTTLTMGYSVGTDLYIVHAGDTRAYLFHDGMLDQVTNDHTLVQLLVDHGALTKEAARTHKRRNVVTNVVGGPSVGVTAEIHKLRVELGDVLLLCSDGLWEPLGDQAIEEALASAESPETVCDRLIEMALQKGAPDNVTAVVARYQMKADC